MYAAATCSVSGVARDDSQQPGPEQRTHTTSCRMQRRGSAAGPFQWRLPALDRGEADPQAALG